MNSRESAALEAHQFFAKADVPYVIIGGMAVQHWGEPRFTQDVDLTVAIPLEETTPFIQQILNYFTPRLDDALEFALRNRVILVNSSSGCNLDISLGLPGYEDEVMRRALDYEITPGKFVRLCSAEDLIIHKAIASRPQDSRDIEGIVYRQGRKLDVDYIRKWLTAFAGLLYRPEISEAFEISWQKIN